MAKQPKFTCKKSTWKHISNERNLFKINNKDTLMIWDKVFKNGPCKICLSRPYHFKFFKGCLPQILLDPLLNTLSHIIDAIPLPLLLTLNWINAKNKNLTKANLLKRHFFFRNLIKLKIHLYYIKCRLPFETCLQFGISENFCNKKSM